MNAIRTDNANANEYETRERYAARASMAALQRAPLRDRKEAAQGFLDLCNDPPRFRERMDWLAEGCYGFGPYLLVRDIIAMKRANRGAMLAQLLAAFECRCPQREAAKVYRDCSPAWQRRTDAMLRACIRRAERAAGEVT